MSIATLLVEAFLYVAVLPFVIIRQQVKTPDRLARGLDIWTLDYK